MSGQWLIIPMGRDSVRDYTRSGGVNFRSRLGFKPKLKIRDMHAGTYSTML